MNDRQVNPERRVGHGPEPVDEAPELGRLGERRVEQQKANYAKVSVSLWHPLSSMKSIWDYVTSSSKDVFVCQQMHDALACAEGVNKKDEVFTEIVALWEGASGDSKKCPQLIKPLLDIASDSRIDASTRAEILKLLCEKGDVNLWRDKRFLNAAKKIINDGNLPQQDLEELFDKVLGSGEQLKTPRAAHRVLARMLFDCPAEKWPTSLALHLTEKLATYAAGDYSEEKNLISKHISSHRKKDSERFERLCQGLASKPSINGDALSGSLKRMAKTIDSAYVDKSEALRHGFLAIAGNADIDFSTRLEVVSKCLRWLKKEQSESFSKHAFPIFGSLLKDGAKESDESQAQLKAVLAKYMETFDDPHLIYPFKHFLDALSGESRQLFTDALVRSPEPLLLKRLGPCFDILTKTDLEALSENKDASLQARMHVFGRYLEKLGHEVTPCRSEGGPLNACKIALADNKTPLDKRIDAFNALIDYKDLLSRRSDASIPPLSESQLSNYCCRLCREIRDQPQDRISVDGLFRSWRFVREDERGLVLDAMKSRMSVDEILNGLPDEKDRSYALGWMFEQKHITPAGLLIHSRTIKNETLRTALITDKFIPSLEQLATPEDIFAVVLLLVDSKLTVPDPLWDRLMKEVVWNPDCSLKLRFDSIMLKQRFCHEELEPFKDQYQAILNNSNPSISQICDVYSVGRSFLQKGSAEYRWFFSGEDLRSSLSGKEGLDPRLQLLIDHGLVFEPNKNIDADSAKFIHEEVEALMKDPDLSREQKFLLAFLPLENLVRAGALDLHVDLLAYYLDLANGFYSDLAEIPVRDIKTVTGIKAVLERAREKPWVGEKGFSV